MSAFDDFSDVSQMLRWSSRSLVSESTIDDARSIAESIIDDWADDLNENRVLKNDLENRLTSSLSSDCFSFSNIFFRLLVIENSIWMNSIWLNLMILTRSKLMQYGMQLQMRTRRVNEKKTCFWDDFRMKINFRLKIFISEMIWSEDINWSVWVHR